MQQNRLSAARRWAPVTVWMALIFAFSTDWFAAPNTSALFQPLLSWLLPGIAPETIQIVHAVLRKLGHLSEYFILAILLTAAGQTQWPKQNRGSRFLTTVIFATLYAISDEWHQSFVPSRSASAVDVMIDACGAICGAFWTLYWGTTHTTGDKREPVAKKT